MGVNDTHCVTHGGHRVGETILELFQSHKLTFPQVVAQKLTVIMTLTKGQQIGHSHVHKTVHLKFKSFTQISK